MFIIKKLMKHLSNFTWTGIIITIAFHMLMSYLGLFFLGESELVQNFFYFYTVTGSTVGYGDFSPVTALGKYFVVLWIVPGGIALFTSILGKIVASIQSKVNRMKNGMGNFEKLSDHVIVVGYKQGDTERLFRETKQKLGETDKVVVSTSPVCAFDNWIKAETITDKGAYKRAGINTASRVVVMLDNDGQTTNAIMAIMSMIGKMEGTDKLPNVVAFIEDEVQADLIRQNFPYVECVVSNKVSYLARSMADPGISEVFEALSSSAHGHTLYSHTVERHDSCGRNVDDFEKNGSSVIALKQNGKMLFVNNHSKVVFREGDTVYYVSSNRIE